VIETAKVLAEFSTGFTDSHGLFTFVNVSTRQVAANKIKGWFPDSMQSLLSSAKRDATIQSISGCLPISMHVV